MIGKDLVIVNQNEPTSLGAAILAAVKLGLYKDLNSAVDSSVKIRKVFNPISSHNKIYESQYKIFLDLYERLEVMFTADA